jgi:hypothetical protein
MEEEYVAQITLYSIARLVKEPEFLRNEVSLIDRSIRQLAVDHYQCFLENARVVDQTCRVIESCVETLNQFDGIAKDLSKVIVEWESSVKDARKRQISAFSMERNQLELIELLEIPQLMESCVRHGMFEQALDLRFHVDFLRQRHSELAILDVVQEQMQSSCTAMSEKLLAEMESMKTSLPSILKCIAFLRRLDQFSEEELETQFLARRSKWFQEELDRISTRVDSSKDTVYLVVSRILDFHRVHVFEIFTHHRSVFVKEQGSHNFLVSWAQKTIFDLLHVLEKYSFHLVSI